MLIEEMTDLEVAKHVVVAPIKREDLAPLNNPFSSLIRAFNLLERGENIEMALNIFIRVIEFHKSVLD